MIILDEGALARATSIRDLTDPAEGPHAMQILVSDLAHRLQHTRIVRGPRIVPVADNYDRLRIPRSAVTRDARYTRYVSADAVLRTHTSAMIPPAISDEDVVLLAPGIVYRRDCIDRLHTGEPHQMDVWRISRTPLGEDDLAGLIDAVVTTLLPGRTWTTTPAVHPYTLAGRQIDVDGIEIGECGLAHPEIACGLAMGIGLDRVLMLRKGIDDIRLLRSTDPRVASQMLDLAPYRPVSSMPETRRDLSIAVASDATAEELGDRVRAVDLDGAVEEIAIVSETPGEALPAVARERLGLRDGQKNVLVRVVLRHPTRTLTHAEANALRNAIYAVLHEGDVKTWAA